MAYVSSFEPIKKHRILFGTKHLAAGGLQLKGALNMKQTYHNKMPSFFSNRFEQREMLKKPPSKSQSLSRGCSNKREGSTGRNKQINMQSRRQTMQQSKCPWDSTLLRTPHKINLSSVQRHSRCKTSMLEASPQSNQAKQGELNVSESYLKQFLHSLMTKQQAIQSSQAKRTSHQSQKGTLGSSSIYQNINNGFIYKISAPDTTSFSQGSHSLHHPIPSRLLRSPLRSSMIYKKIKVKEGSTQTAQLEVPSKHDKQKFMIRLQTPVISDKVQLKFHRKSTRKASLTSNLIDTQSGDEGQE